MVHKQPGGKIGQNNGAGGMRFGREIRQGNFSALAKRPQRPFRQTAGCARPSQEQAQPLHGPFISACLNPPVKDRAGPFL